MAKKKGPSRKSESQIALESQYKRVRKNLLKNIRRMTARGYDVSGIKVPKIPQRIEPGSVRALERLNEQRYAKSKYTLTEIKVVKGKETIVEKAVSGTKGREAERKISAIKGVATRKRNKADKEARIAKALEETKKTYTAESMESSINYDEARERREHKQYLRELYESADNALAEGREDEYYETRDTIKYIEYADSHEGFYEFAYKLNKAGTEYSHEDIIKAYEMAHETTLDGSADVLAQLEAQGSADYYDGDYSMDPSTGEVRKTSELTEKDKSGKTWIVLQSLETAQELYTKAMQDLDVMIQYEGTTRDGYSKVANIHNNAQMIKDFIQESFAREPERTAAVLRNMMDQDGFHTVDFMYATGGYQRFLKYYNSAFVFEDIEDED